LITATTRNNILVKDIFISLIPTFGKHSLIMLTYCNGPKVGIKILKISFVRILFLVSLLFVAVINPYSVFLNFQFLNILVDMHEANFCVRDFHVYSDILIPFVRDNGM